MSPFGKKHLTPDSSRHSFGSISDGTEAQPEIPRGLTLETVLMMMASFGHKLGGKGKTIVNPYEHVGRNDPCPCGCGRKFKQCPDR